LQDSKLWWDSDFVENAIDAIADSQIIFEGFDVDIGGAFHDGFADDLVDEFDHAGLGIIVGDVFGFVLVIGAVGSGGGEDFVEGFGPDTVDGFDGAKEETAGDDDPIDFAVGSCWAARRRATGLKTSKVASRTADSDTAMGRMWCLKTKREGRSWRAARSILAGSMVSQGNLKRRARAAARVCSSTFPESRARAVQLPPAGGWRAARVAAASAVRPASRRRVVRTLREVIRGEERVRD